MKIQINFESLKKIRFEKYRSVFELKVSDLCLMKIQISFESLKKSDLKNTNQFLN